MPENLPLAPQPPPPAPFVRSKRETIVGTGILSVLLAMALFVLAVWMWVAARRGGLAVAVPSQPTHTLFAVTADCSTVMRWHDLDDGGGGETAVNCGAREVRREVEGKLLCTLSFRRPKSQ